MLYRSATDLAGADLPVNVRLLANSVLQVRDVGLEPVPVADDGGSLHCVTALCSLPSVGQERRSLSERFMLRVRHHGKKEVLNISVIIGQRFWMEQLSFYVIDSAALAPALDDKTGPLNCFNNSSQEMLWKICCKHQNETQFPTASITRLMQNLACVLHTSR